MSTSTNNSPGHYYSVLITVKKEYGAAFAEALEPHVSSVYWTAQEEASLADVQGYSEDLPDQKIIAEMISVVADAVGEASPNLKIEKKENRNWVLENIKQFPPIQAGRFFVHSAEYKDPVPQSLIGLRVPAGAAFGSGEHGSTKGCLLAIDKMNSMSIRSALDMGCGSGILAIAAAKRWYIPVVATDIDPISMDVTRENAEINGVARYVRSLCGPGYSHPEVSARRYDLIISNILAWPLTRLAKDLGRHLNPGGFAILSGLLLRDANRIISAHRNQGIHLHSRVTLGEWGTLILKKPI